MRQYIWKTSAFTLDDLITISGERYVKIKDVNYAKLGDYIEVLPNKVAKVVLIERDAIQDCTTQYETVRARAIEGDDYAYRRKLQKEDK